MQEFSVTCFGVGDGMSCPDRNHASFLYRLGKTSLLVDCGEPVDGCLKASGVSHDSVDGIFLSHLHADHVGGFFMLMQGCWLEGRRQPLTVHLPGGAIKPTRAMLRTCLIFDELLKFRLRFAALKARKPVCVGNAKVTPFPSTHLDSLRDRFQKRYRSDFHAFSFLIEAGRKRIAHSADLGRIEDLNPLLEKPLDLLICEAAHFTPEELFSHLRGRAVKRVVFVHLGRPYWENLPKTRRLAAKLLPGIPHIFARDNQTVSF